MVALDRVIRLTATGLQSFLRRFVRNQPLAPADEIRPARFDQGFPDGEVVLGLEELHQGYGATDEFGYHAVQNVTTMHDLHATILHLLGFDHTKLTYRHAGRDYRLTDVHGEVMKPIQA